MLKQLSSNILSFIYFYVRANALNVPLIFSLPYPRLSSACVKTYIKKFFPIAVLHPLSIP